MAETKEQYMKQLKKAASEFGTALDNRDLETAYELSGKVREMLKDEMYGEFQVKELEAEGIHSLEANLKKYYYHSGNIQKAKGALVKRGQEIVDALG